MVRLILLIFFLLACSDLFAAEPEPQYTRTRQLPALKMTFVDMQLVLDKAATLLADANREAKEAKEAKVKQAKGFEAISSFFQSSPRETLTLGTGADEIEIAGHRFPTNARVPKAAYAFSYSYSWGDMPVSKLELDLRDYARRLSVSGTAVNQVEAISAAIEGDLLQHSATGGDTLRYVVIFLGVFIFSALLVIGGVYCVLEHQWRYIGVPIVSLIGLVVLLITVPLKDFLPGFAVYQGEASLIVRDAPQIAFVGLIITVVLSFLIPMFFTSHHAAPPPENDPPEPNGG